MALNIIGDTYGYLTVLEFSHKKGYRKFFKCRCSCGNTCIVYMGHLRSGHTTSCGCYQIKNPPRKSHGKAGHRLYKIYYEMLARCNNPQSSNYSRYGGKGIKVSSDFDTFEKFQEWAENSGYASNLTIDRIDSNKDYSIENCRWATYQEQAYNTKVNIRNTSGYKNVYFVRGSKDKWCFILTDIYGNRKRVSQFTSPLEAHNAKKQLILSNNDFTHYKESLKYEP